MDLDLTQIHVHQNNGFNFDYSAPSWRAPQVWNFKQFIRDYQQETRVDVNPSPSLVPFPPEASSGSVVEPVPVTSRLYSGDALKPSWIFYWSPPEVFIGYGDMALNGWVFMSLWDNDDRLSLGPGWTVDLDVGDWLREASFEVIDFVIGTQALHVGIILKGVIKATIPKDAKIKLRVQGGYTFEGGLTQNVRNFGYLNWFYEVAKETINSVLPVPSSSLEDWDTLSEE